MHVGKVKTLLCLELITGSKHSKTKFTGFGIALCTLVLNPY
jgi:hypothetical protein